MDFWKIEPGKATALMAAGERLPEQGFAWLDLAYDEVDLLQAEVERLTGVRIFDVHIGDAKNLSHPSFFDNTDTYEIVVFRGLSPQTTVDEIVTRPMTFFNFDRLLVTVRAADSRSVAQVKSRFVNLPGKMPQSPDDLMQRLLSAMVDHYLELRQPLAQRLDDWQRLLLDPRKPFRDWVKLLESRQQIREAAESFRGAARRDPGMAGLSHRGPVAGDARALCRHRRAHRAGAESRPHHRAARRSRRCSSTSPR